MKFNFRRRVVELRKSEYQNKRLALLVVDSKTKESVGTLTINVPDIDVPADEFAIKTWSENEELAEVAYNTGWFDDTCKRSKSGYAIVEFWRFTDSKLLDQIKPI